MKLLFVDITTINNFNYNHFSINMLISLSFFSKNGGGKNK